MSLSFLLAISVDTNLVYVIKTLITAMLFLLTGQINIAMQNNRICDQLLSIVDVAHNSSICLWLQVK